jgi:antitoxin ParD1/3/4
MNQVVKLKPELAAFIDEAVASGEYGSGEAVVEEAVREWHQRRQNHGYTLAELRRLVQEGLDSGPSIDGETAVSAIREKALTRMKAR